MNDYLNKEKKLHFVYLILLMFLSAFAYNLLVVPISLVTGGTGGLAIIFKEIFSFNVAFSTLIMYVFTLLISALLLDREDTMAAVVITFLYPLFIMLTEGVVNIINIDYTNPLIVVIFAGVINGVINGFLYKFDLNPGGIGLISKVVYKYYNVSVTLVNFILNSIIIISGGFIFGYEMILYAAVYLFLTKIISDKIIMGISSNKVFNVVSMKSDEIKNVLSLELGHDSTIYKLKDNDRKMLMVVVPNKDYYIVKEVIEKIDKDAFSFISDGYEVNGVDSRIKMLSK